MATKSLFKLLSKQDPDLYSRAISNDKGFGNRDSIRYRFGGDEAKINAFYDRLQQIFDENQHIMDKPTDRVMDYGRHLQSPSEFVAACKHMKCHKAAGIKELKQLKDKFDQNMSCKYNKCSYKRDINGKLLKKCYC